jgi:probable F420-dependent oxidoreductase
MKVSLGLGLMEFPFATPAGFWRWVDLCEAGGVDSLWQTDRIVSRAPILESLTTMAVLAGRTRRLKFGMNVVSLAFRDPVLLAKQCATIDVLSDGRLLPAFGIGSPLSPEWKALGLDTATRGRRTDEALDIIARLWRGERVTLQGRFNRLDDVAILPLPLQPELPMWIGGSSEAAIRRTARHGTGWIGGAEPPVEAGRIVAAIKTATAAAGRAIDDDHYGVGLPFHFGSPDDPALHGPAEAFRKRTGRDPATYFAVGDADAMLARVADYVAHGVTKFVCRPLLAGEDAVLAQTRLFVERLQPLVAQTWPR